MIDHKTMCSYATALAADVVAGAQRIIAGDSEPTDEEAQAILQLTCMVAAVLEAHAVHALPPDLARHVRAFIERLTSDVQRCLTSSGTAPVIITPTAPAEPEKATPHA